MFRFFLKMMINITMLINAYNFEILHNIDGSIQRKGFPIIQNGATFFLVHFWSYKKTVPKEYKD